MGIQINGNTNNINAGIGSLSIEDLNELDIIGVATAANFKTGVSDLHSVGLTLSGGQIDVGSNIKLGNAGVITATSFVGSGANLTGITQVGGSTGVDFNDNVKARFGTGNDLEIYHNGSNSYIDDVGTGALNIRSSGIYLEKANGAEVMASFIADGAATLYHNGSAKIATTSGGVSVTGALSVSGNLGTGFFEIGDDTATTTATTQVSIASFSASSVRSCKLLVQVTNTTDSTYHFTEIAIIHDGTDTYMTETGTMFTGTAAEATFTSDISSGSVRLLATPASTDSMTFKVVRQMITV